MIGYTVKNDEIYTFLLAIETFWRRLIGAFGSRVTVFLTDTAGSFKDSRVGAVHLRMTISRVRIEQKPEVCKLTLLDHS